MNILESEQTLRNNCENYGININIRKYDMSKQIGHHHQLYICIVRLQDKNLKADYQSVHSSMEVACTEAIAKALKCFESI